MRRLANLIFLAAVLAINFTLARPSPVDFLFIAALVVTALSRQIVTRNVVVLFFLISAWLLSMWLSSINLLDEPEVLVQAQKITYALSISICAALVTSNWDDTHYRRFFRTVVVATCIAATLGMSGFLLGIEDLLWDGRARAFLDDPNMYSAFLLPGVISSMYLLSQGGRPRIYGAAIALLIGGALFGFSRVALVSLAIWGGTYYVIMNRHRLPKAIFIAVSVVAVFVAVVSVASLVDADLAAKITDRSTVAKEYDLGHTGRYGRYELAVPLILENPRGMGILEMEKIWPEPIHNLLISSFLNYGWIAGFSFLLLLIGTVAVSIGNYRATRNPICLAILFCWLTIDTCTFVHETERWRHLWMFFGMVWGLNVRNLAVLPLARLRAARSDATAPRVAVTGVPVTGVAATGVPAGA